MSHQPEHPLIFMNDSETRTITNAISDHFSGAVSYTPRFEQYENEVARITVDVDFYGKHVVLVTNLCTLERLARVAMLIMHICNYHCAPKQLTVVITSYPWGTEDRTDRDGAVVTAKTALDLIWCCAGSMPTAIYVCEPHTLQLCSFSRGCVQICVMRTLLRRAQGNTPATRVCVVMPDDGANKRYRNIVRGMNMRVMICSKTRAEPGAVPHVTVINDDRPGDDINGMPQLYLIIDDMTRSGGTLMECAAAIRRSLAVYDPASQQQQQQHAIRHPVMQPMIAAAVVHADFVNGTIDKIVDSKAFDHFYVTDSIPNKAEQLKKHPMFVVMPLADTLIDTISKIRSISQ
jgi:phosphoribosylpyrophosphate synthetase